MTLTKPTQSDRVLAFLRDHPLATALDIAHGCHPWVSNPRARISDLRAAGYTIKPVRRADGRTGFRVEENEQAVMFGEMG
jgi:helix-turn-helix protein